MLSYKVLRHRMVFTLLTTRAKNLTTQNMTLCIKSGQPVLDWCAATYLEHIIPGKKITVDKSMFKFKGEVIFQTVSAHETGQIGHKTLSTVWLWNWCSTKVHTGKSNNGDSGRATKNVVMTLLEPLLGKGHVVNMGNYYTSPDLVAELKIAGTGVTGSVRANQKHLAPNIKTVWNGLKKENRPHDCVGLAWWQMYPCSFFHSQYWHYTDSNTFGRRPHVDVDPAMRIKTRSFITKYENPKYKPDYGVSQQQNL